MIGMTAQPGMQQAMQAPPPVVAEQPVLPEGDAIKRRLPAQDMDILRRHLHRFDRASRASHSWAMENKECIEFFEGNQWSLADRAKMAAEGRPVLTINKIKRLLNLVWGYQRQNRFEPIVHASADPSSDEDVAKILTQSLKNDLNDNLFEHVEATVFQDGTLGGRGFFDIRLSFAQNLYGSVKIVDLDPAAVYIDPDASGYDPDTWNYVFVSHWMSLETILLHFGAEAYFKSQSLQNGSPFPTLSSEALQDDVTAQRYFGLYSWFGDNDDSRAFFGEQMGLNLQFSEFYDKGQKIIRVLEQQHMKLCRMRYFVDADTGEMVEIPESWGNEEIGACLEEAALERSDVRVISRVEKRIRWTVSAGDILLYDDWSPYKHFTVVPYFPYFRRGKTRGMVADLIDPQREVNKRRAAFIHIVGTTANSGWWYERGSLTPDQEANLKNNGARPGFVGVYEKGKTKPERIDSSPPPTAMERLERSSAEDLTEVSGVNESALGEQDVVQSGVAIANRQKQAVVALVPILDNLKLTRTLVARNILAIQQQYYTEKRFIRAIGADRKPTQLVMNDIDAIGNIKNDVTMGRYGITIESVPATATYQQRAFNQMLEIVKSGVIPPQLAADLLIQLSEVEDKQELIARIQMAIGAGAPLPADSGGTTASPPTGADIGGGTGA